MIENNRKAELLGMPFGTATSKLRKALMFKMARELKIDDCYRCGLIIETIDDFSIEHKNSWMFSENPVKAFFDLENIAFSHMSCNAKAGRKPPKRWPDPQTKSREVSRIRAKSIENEHDKKIRRERYASGLNPNRAKRS